MGQTMMFSATVTDELQHLAEGFLQENYMQINMASMGHIALGIDQRFVNVADIEDVSALVLQSLRGVTRSDGKPARAIVFANSISDVDTVAEYLQDSGMQVASLHSELPVVAKKQAIRNMRSGDVEVLVATDMASRGMDIPNIDHILNFGLSGDPEDYFHRIGRTGRMGNSGVATTLIHGDEHGLNMIVEKLQEAADQDSRSPPPPQWLKDMADRVTCEVVEVTTEADAEVDMES